MTEVITSEKLLPCRECEAPCSVQVFSDPEKGINATLWMCSKHRSLGGDCPNETAYLFEEAWNDRPSPITGEEVRDQAEDEAYEIGKREGYDSAVHDIDLMTGGDGEYRFCTNLDPERHCPDADTMKRRIADRFSTLNIGKGQA